MCIVTSSLKNNQEITISVEKTISCKVLSGMEGAESTRCAVYGVV